MHLLACVSLVVAAALAQAQPSKPAADRWGDFRFLLGDWAGEGRGQPGSTVGTATFKLDLDGRVMVRTSRTTVPANGKQPAYVHEDLLVIYRDAPGQPAKAIYFDNEDHTIEYPSVVTQENTITFSSAAVASAPRFRLVYTRTGADRVDVSFEMAPPGSPEAFKAYTRGVTRRVKKWAVVRRP